MFFILTINCRIVSTREASDAFLCLEAMIGEQRPDGWMWCLLVSVVRCCTVDSCLPFPLSDLAFLCLPRMIHSHTSSHALRAFTYY